VVTVVAVADPATRPNRMPDAASTDLIVNPTDLAIALS